MHITILGASRFGVATAKHLIEEGHEAILIDKDKERLEALADELDCGMIHGDGTLPSTLRDAFGDGSDALIALTNQDDVNILASVVGRSIGYDRVIPQIVRPELLSVVEELDLDDTITPHESVAQSIVSSLSQHSEMETDMTLHRELRIVSHRISDALAGRTVGKLDLPKGSRAIALVRDKTERLIEPRLKLRERDSLMLIVPSDRLEEVGQLFASG